MHEEWAHTRQSEESEEVKLGRRIAEEIAENLRLKNLLLEVKNIRTKESKDHAEEISRLNSMVAEEESHVSEGRSKVCHCHAIVTLPFLSSHFNLQLGRPSSNRV